MKMNEKKETPMKSNAKKVITGEWDGQPIWRYQTPEEKLAEAGIPEELARLHIAIDQSHD